MPPGPAVTVNVVAQRGPAGADRPVENAPDCRRQRRQLRFVEAMRWGERMKAGAVEGLVGVDVPHARDDRLVEQRGLDAPRRPAERGRQVHGAHAQRIGTETAPLLRQEVGHRRHRGETPEAPRIAEQQRGALRFSAEEPADVDVIFTWGRLAASKEEQLPGHAEMDDKNGGAALGDDGELLAAALEPRDAPPTQQHRAEAARDAAARDRGASAAPRSDHFRAPNFNALNHAADQARLE